MFLIQRELLSMRTFMWGGSWVGTEFSLAVITAVRPIWFVSFCWCWRDLSISFIELCDGLGWSGQVLNRQPRRQASLHTKRNRRGRFSLPVFFLQNSPRQTLTQDPTNIDHWKSNHVIWGVVYTVYYSCYLFLFSIQKFRIKLSKFLINEIWVRTRSGCGTILESQFFD